VKVYALNDVIPNIGNQSFLMAGIMLEANHHHIICTSFQHRLNRAEQMAGLIYDQKAYELMPVIFLFGEWFELTLLDPYFSADQRFRLVSTENISKPDN
jgi:hypothetical protein